MFILNRLDHYSTWNRLYQHSYLKQGVSLFLLEPGCTIIHTWNRLYSISIPTWNRVYQYSYLKKGIPLFLLETGCIIIHTWNRLHHYSYLKQVVQYQYSYLKQGVSSFILETGYTIILTWNMLDHYSYLRQTWAFFLKLILGSQYCFSNTFLFKCCTFYSALHMVWFKFLHRNLQAFFTDCRL